MSNIPTNVLIADNGHNVIKGKTASGEIAYPHALLELSLNEYEDIVTKSGDHLSDDYLVVNGRAYVVGEAAEHHGLTNRRTGPERYTADYYGVFVASTLHRLYKNGISVALFASHPTGDVRYREELGNSAWGEWCIEHGTERKQFNVDYVNTYEEALGGVFNVILSESGDRYARSEVREGRVLVIDIGGGTTDLQSITDGQVTYDVADSIEIGIRQVEAEFERSLRANNSQTFKGIRHIDAAMLREAIRTGKYTGGGKEIACGLEVKSATNKLLNQIRNIYTGKGRGAANWHHIVLTGGGSAMLYEYLQEVLRHGSVILAEDNLAELHLANVRGGMKLWKLWKSQGWL